MTPLLPEEAERRFRQLLSERKLLSISLVDPSGEPILGMVPFLFYKHRFHLYVSSRSGHGLELGRSTRAALLLAKDQQETAQPFALERATFRCRCRPADPEELPTILAMMEERFGSIVAVLGGLDDFACYTLFPEEGRYVAGFGNAFSLSFREPWSLTPLR